MQESRERSEHHVGVCHLTARAAPGTDVALLPIRLVMTTDVNGVRPLTRHILGPDAACEELRAWMARLCAEAVGGTDSA